MRCGQCGRKLTAAALALGYCPSCGNHLAPEVNAPRGSMPPAEALPARQPAPALAAPHSNSAPPDAVPATPLPVAGAPTIAPRKRSSAPLILSVFVLIALVGGGLLFTQSAQGMQWLAQFPKGSQAVVPTVTATATATATPLPPTATPLPAVPTPPTGFKTFISEDGIFGLNYAQDWTQSKPPLTNGVSYNFVSGDAQQFAQVTEFNATIDPASVATYLQTFVNSSNGSNFNVTEAANPVTLDQVVWMRAQGTYDLNGQPQRIIGFAANHDSHGFIILYTAPSAAYEIVAGSVFQEMVSSFTFLR